MVGQLERGLPAAIKPRHSHSSIALDCGCDTIDGIVQGLKTKRRGRSIRSANLFRIIHRWLTLGIAFACLPAVLRASTESKYVFAPSLPLVSSQESPFRHDICLNGRWQFQPENLPAGFRPGIDPAPALPLPLPSAWEATKIKIPSTWNANSFADRQGLGGDFRTYPSYPKSWEKVEMGWLRRSVTVPQAWHSKRIFLHFQAAAGDIRVLVNGKEAGSRFDIFFPFEIDITDLISFGAENEILIGVRKPDLFDVKGKYGRREYQAGSFWGQHVVGLWQDVDLLAVSPVRITNTVIRPDVHHELLNVIVSLRNDTDREAAVDLQAEVHKWVGNTVSAAEPSDRMESAVALQLKGKQISIPAHSEREFSFEQRIHGELQLWSPDHPNLYTLLSTIRSKGKLVDCLTERFGWRQFEIEGSRFLLNGKPIVLEGDSWHFLGVPQMTRRYAWAWFSAMRAAHLNAVRLHAEPYPEFYLDVADEMGILVLDETAIWASDGGPKLDSEKFWADTDMHVAELVKRDRNHPSVFGWSVSNEVKPVVENVFHGPPGMLATLYKHYERWVKICRDLDPTRAWISADGDGDGGGRLPVVMLHYGGTESMISAQKTGKPWGVGESSGAYYSTPEQSAKFNGERSYESFEGRMEGVAKESYDLLRSQSKYGANYRSVFNMVWYALQPLPLGMTDTSRPPALSDGVFFPPYREGQPGVQPERLGPYSTTLNPGYDPKLPLYKPWPMFDAIRDANAGRPAWSRHAEASTNEMQGGSKAPAAVHSVAVLADERGTLRQELVEAGVPKSLIVAPQDARLLFIDGRNPPLQREKVYIDAALEHGKRVVVWGAKAETLDRLNKLLPVPMSLNERKTSMLVVTKSSELTAGLRPSDLYFSEDVPPFITEGCLDGRLISEARVLLAASDTEWTKWNKQPEYAKTAMIVRSEREAKPSGAVIAEMPVGPGYLTVVDLPSWSSTYRVQLLDRRLLKNLGLTLDPQVDVGEPFLRNGKLARVLAAGWFAPGEDNMLNLPLDNAHNEKVRDNERIGNLRWGTLKATAGVIDLNVAGASVPPQQSVSYVSFWIQSPRSLDNLLIEPNIPRLDLLLTADDAAHLFLNGREQALTAPGDFDLPLQQGWNHILFRFVKETGSDTFSAVLRSSDPGFLSALHSALQRP